MPRIIFFLSICIMFFAAFTLKVQAEVRPGESAGGMNGLILAGNMVETAERTGEEAKWQRWQRLSPDERARLKERYEEYQKLPPEERERLRRNFERFRSLPPEEKERLRKRYRFWQSLPPEEKRSLRRHQGWQEGPSSSEDREGPDKRQFKGPSKWQGSPPGERRGLPHDMQKRDSMRSRGHRR
ncbi:MAG: DUF3106 domain-containing protein [Deltaproteobacteria bacterium]|nr:DUF3106 domain-containing protein [Deltaproteobacteria bacterium]